MESTLKFAPGEAVPIAFRGPADIDLQVVGTVIRLVAKAEPDPYADDVINTTSATVQGARDAVIELESSETANIAPGTYHYDIWVTEPDTPNKPRRVIEWEKLIVERAPHNPGL